MRVVVLMSSFSSRMANPPRRDRRGLADCKLMAGAYSNLLHGAIVRGRARPRHRRHVDRSACWPRTAEL